MARYSKIKEFKEKRQNDVKDVLSNIENAVSITKCNERFYQPELLIKAFNTIDTALELASLPYYPNLIQFHDYGSPFFKLTYENIKQHCLNKEDNMFYEFFESKIDDILKDNPEYIGISINSTSQLVPGLTLSMLLKQRNCTHVNIGGNFFGRVTETLQQTPEFFEVFADSILIEEGEKPVLYLAEYLEGKISVEDVPNLVYMGNDNKIVVNEKTVPALLNDVKTQDLTGFPLGLYFTPEIVLSAQSSRGCYWRKCSFCDQDFGQNFNIKDTDKLISEMKELNEKFGIKYYEFIDESVGPEYLEELSRKIIENNIDVSWFINARLESAFTPELLELANKAGLKMVLWGFESGSKKVMKLINKGIDIDKRLEILGNAKKCRNMELCLYLFRFSYRDMGRWIENY